MQTISMKKSESVFRVDKFIVPAEAKERFLDAVFNTHELLDSMHGCIQNRVLEQLAGPGRYNIVTIVEWKDAAAMEGAKTAIAEQRARSGFDPQELMQRLRIEADLANYREIGR